MRYPFVLVVLSLIALCSLSLAQELNVLVIGSTHSYSEREIGQAGVTHEKPFDPSGIASHLQNILAQDPANADSVLVEFEDIYKFKRLDTSIGGGGAIWDITYYCHSLIQHFMWPEGKETRLSDLRGEGTREWDYIVLSGDPYVMANMPGVYAEGVKAIQGEVSKSANPAQIVLLGQWPENSSGFSASDFNEVAFRIGDSAGLPVVPAGKAWDAFTAQDTASAHPTPKGEYLAAAAIYSSIFGRDASTSGFTFDDTIATHAFNVVQSNDGVDQFAGKYTIKNPFQIKYYQGRQVDWNEYGTSTEEGFAGGLNDALAQARVGSVRRNPPASGNPVDLSYSRGNDNFEEDKQYRVDAAMHDRVHGFPMGDHRNTGPVTMRYGIDKRYQNDFWFINGTDLGIGYSMIREGEVPQDVRGIPVRLLWSKINHFRPEILSHRDGWHLSRELDRAVGAYMFTLLTGRCPVEAEPADESTTAWKQWFTRKLGYETAWQMAHLTTRAPGLRVLPSATNAKTVTPGGTEAMTVHFVNPPQADVTVTVSISNPAAAIVGPATLVFTPENYNTPQNVTVRGIQGAAASETFNAVFDTTSDDAIYDGLSDAWAYTINRSSPQSVSTVDKGTSLVTAFRDTPKAISLDTAAANSGNTQFAGPNHGILSWSGADVVYTPDAGFTGKDGFAFAVLDSGVLSSGVVEIDVLDEAPVGTVSYNGNGNDSGAVPFDGNTYAENDTVTVLGNTGGLVKTGHSFAGWNTEFDGSGENYAAGDPLTMGAEGVILFAQWVADTYTISYAANDATSGSVPADQTKTFGIDLELSGNTGGLTRTGFNFVGWNTAANGSGQSFAGGATFTLEQSTTLYAEWNAPPEVNAGANQSATLSGSVAWSPSDISLSAWYDAADAATITESAGAVSQWDDKSGSGNHATQDTSARRPVSGSKNINGANTIDFDATTDQFLNMPAVDVIGKEVWSVFLIDDYTTTNSQLLLGAGGNVQIGVNSSSESLRLWQQSSVYAADTKSSANVPVNTPTVVGWLAHTDTKKFSLNGVLEDTGDTYNSGSMTPIYIGRGQWARLDAAIGEIIITGGTLSTENRQRMEGYLAHKWGLAGNLPLEHPHKASAPGGPTAVVSLNGTASDPEGGSVTTLWTAVSGPADVAFDDASAADTTATFTAAGTYVLELTADDGSSQPSSQVTITVYTEQVFNDWISGFDVGAQTGPDDDADGDGLPNAVENYFGTDPGVSNPGLAVTQITAEASTTLEFTHPVNDNPAPDLTASYRWSKDLAAFYASGQTFDGTTVTFSQGTPVDGMVTVTATISGTGTNRIFVRLEVTQN